MGGFFVAKNSTFSPLTSPANVRRMDVINIFGQMKQGPCAERFYASVHCFNASVSVPRGFDCHDEAIAMAMCFEKVCSKKISKEGCVVN